MNRPVLELDLWSEVKCWKQHSFCHSPNGAKVRKVSKSNPDTLFLCGKVEPPLASQVNSARWNTFFKNPVVFNKQVVLPTTRRRINAFRCRPLTSPYWLSIRMTRSVRLKMSRQSKSGMSAGRSSGGPLCRKLRTCLEEMGVSSSVLSMKSITVGLRMVSWNKRK